MQKENKLTRNFIIGTFVALYIMVSIISTIHVIDFFKLSNPEWLAITLAIAFEVGAAASLASIIALRRMNKSIVWSLFFTLTAMQAMGNAYFAYVHLVNYQAWVELFGLVDSEVIEQKRILSIVSGAILPLVALGFIKSLVDYIKPDDTVNDTINEGVKAVVQDQITDAVTSNNLIETYNQEPPYQPTNEDIKKFEELLRKYDEKFQNNTVDELVETPKIEEKTIETAELIEDVITDESTDPIIEDVIIEEENIEPEIVVNEEIIVEEENIEEDVINTYEEIIVEEENIEPKIVVNEEIIVEEENIEPEIAVNEQFIIGVEIVNDNEEVIEKKN